MALVDQPDITRRRLGLNQMNCEQLTELSAQYIRQLMQKHLSQGEAVYLGNLAGNVGLPSPASSIDSPPPQAGEGLGQQETWPTSFGGLVGGLEVPSEREV
jgi:hypothetical protein